MRAAGAASAFLALVVTMTAERPTVESLGLGLLGIVAFAVSCLFKGGKAARSQGSVSAARTETPEPSASGFAGYGLSATDDAATMHPALMAGVQPTRR